jgi:hypothetical protein
MQPVVIIRHPAAFAVSLRRVGWAFPFADFTRQPLLMRDLLEPFATEIGQAASSPPPILDQAGLLWRILHHVVDRQRREHPDWIFVRHEDLSSDPIPRFAQLYAALGLEMTPEARNVIVEHTSAANPVEAPGGVVETLRRDSRANAFSWRERLTASEIRELRAQVADVADAFYGPDEW